MQTVGSVVWRWTLTLQLPTVPSIAKVTSDIAKVPWDAAIPLNIFTIITGRETKTDEYDEDDDVSRPVGLLASQLVGHSVGRSVGQ